MTDDSGEDFLGEAIGVRVMNNSCHISWLAEENEQLVYTSRHVHNAYLILRAYGMGSSKGLLEERCDEGKSKPQRNLRQASGGPVT